MSWETSYSLPGEQHPPRVRADVSVDWPTWSQTSYRSWSIGEPPDELPEVVIEVALRVQRLAVAPDTHTVLAALPEEKPLLGTEPLVRRATTIEEVHDGDRVRWAVEATYEGSVRFSGAQLEDPDQIHPGRRQPDPMDRLSPSSSWPTCPSPFCRPTPRPSDSLSGSPRLELPGPGQLGMDRVLRVWPRARRAPRSPAAALGLALGVLTP